MRLAAGVVALCLGAAMLCAQAPAVGASVELRGTHHLGVPLHKKVGGSDDFDRVPHGARAKVEEVQEEGRWLRITLVPSGRAEWISSRYVGRVLPASPVAPAPADPKDLAKVWQSGSSCLEVVSAGRRMAKSDPDALIVGTWNIRWFAKGCSPNETCPENRTDLDWLACSIAWMQVDVLAVQEVMRAAIDVEKLAVVLGKLNELTQGSWQWDFQECGNSSSQRVGFLWNGSRIKLSNRKDVWQLNPNAVNGDNACAGFLRPGRYARAEAVGGGADFNIIAVHLDSGTSDRDYQNRRKSVEALTGIEIDGKPLPEIDADTIVLGDFNTMGRKEEPAISASQEIEAFREELRPAFQRVPGSLACTEYFQDKGGVLDHMVVSAGMSEAAAAGRVSGYCAVRACAPFTGAPPAAYQRLSDHCPVLIEITNTDADQ
ncbi:MAG: hypothetical protein FJW20_20780 [Acidimicrobiia bacterium]|nr:hypothetical protein [Acidimicrobiia bacterium]